jgi:hypothetical protein
MTLAALGNSASHLNSNYSVSGTAVLNAPGTKTSTSSVSSTQASASIAFPQAVQQTLSDLGLTADTTSSGSVLLGRRDHTGETATSASAGSQASAQDTHRLMYDLLQAIHHEQSTAAYSADKSAGATAQDNYISSFNAGLQSVIKQVKENPDAMSGNANSALLTVKADYRKLVNDLRAQTASTGTQYPTLSEFLQSLSSTLQSQTSSSAVVGGLINISA